MAERKRERQLLGVCGQLLPQRICNLKDRRRDVCCARQWRGLACHGTCRSRLRLLVRRRPMRPVHPHRAGGCCRGEAARFAASAAASARRNSKHSRAHQLNRDDELLWKALVLQTAMVHRHCRGTQFERRTGETRLPCCASALRSTRPSQSRRRKQPVPQMGE